MDAITTDSGKVYRLEEAYTIADPKIMRYRGDEYARGGGYIKVRRVWVLVEVE